MGAAATRYLVLSTRLNQVVAGSRAELAQQDVAALSQAYRTLFDAYVAFDQGLMQSKFPAELQTALKALLKADGQLTLGMDTAARAKTMAEIRAVEPGIATAARESAQWSQVLRRQLGLTPPGQ